MDQRYKSSLSQDEHAKPNKRQQGALFEQQAERYLIDQGLTAIERNYNCKMGEIDLIMQHGEVCVFVEVRFRKDNHFGGPLASITPSKQAKVRRAAQLYLQQQFGNHPPACRIDAIGIESNGEIQWIQNAF